MGRLISPANIKRYVRDKTHDPEASANNTVRVSDEFLHGLELRLQIVLDRAIRANASWRRYTLKADELNRAWPR